MLSPDVRSQLQEPSPFSEAIRFLLAEHQGNVVKVPHSNPAKRARDELRKMHQDLDDLTLIAKRLDDPKKFSELFSNDNILSFVDAVLDISEKMERTTAISRRSQEIIDRNQTRWMDEAYSPFEKSEITKVELELRRKEIFGSQDSLLGPLQDEFDRERLPDARRCTLAAAIAAMCLDYCSTQLNLAEPDRVNVELYEKVLVHAKELLDSIVGKVNRFQPTPRIKKSP